MQFIYFSIKKKERNKILIKDNLNYILLKKIIKIFEMNCLIFQGFNDVLIENKKWTFSILCKENKNKFFDIKNESYIEMKIKINFIEKKYLNKKLDYIANRLEIFLFNQIYRFFCKF